ncbi:glycosyltransferase [Arthrobacter sp. IA7]|uniref:glycosyltransferase n=1 Tax=Arthrobacter ipis TaxID=2716202 RepID=UPI00168880BB|nr:glycosyltransferase [Arthrobacter ipis]MBD1541862.1 glycosyltransferase [Arthrobacter ipis]
MKIIQIATLVTPDGAYGGPLRVAINQTRALLEANHEVTLVAGAMGYTGKLPEQFDGVPVRLFRAHRPVPKLGFAGVFAPQLQGWLRSALKATDIVHIHMGRDLVTLPSAWMTAHHRVPYVLQTHGMIDASDRLLSKPLDRFLTLPALTAANSVLFLTEHERQALKEIAPGLSNLQELHNGVPQARPTRSSENGAIEVLFLARLQERKRPLLFVEMAKQLHTKFPAVRFVLVGPDEGEGGAVAAAIAEAGMKDALSWEGAVSPEKAADRISRCSIYVLPSVDEPFPMSVLEAMSLGKPVVVTDTCGLASSISGAKAGVVVGPGLPELTAAVESLLANPTVLAEMGNSALELSRRDYSMDQVVGQLCRTYTKAI